MSKHFIENFNIERILSDIKEQGGISFPFLTEEYRRDLLSEAEEYSYIKKSYVSGSFGVKEDVSVSKEFKTKSLFFELKNDFEGLFKNIKNSPSVFSYPLHFDRMMLQLYEKDSLGITPHRDGLSFVNLICVFILTGKADVALCDNREGENPHYLDSSPGNVIILRGPGLFRKNIQPFHFISNIREKRIVFGLRQKLVKEI